MNDVFSGSVTEGIKRVELVCDGSVIAGRAVKVQAKPVVIEGKAKHLVVDGEVLAQKDAPETLLGYDLSLTDGMFEPGAAVLLMAGQNSGQAIVGALAQMPVEGKKFGLRVYCTIRNESGTADGEICFEFSHCTASPCAFSINDGEFFYPTFAVKSRPQKGEPGVLITRFVREESVRREGTE